jgi:heme/copper-type cytochrome/quinol oxidase subunit 3
MQQQENNNQKYMFSIFFFVALIGLLFASFIVGYGMYVAFFKTISDASGEPLSNRELYSFVIPAALAGITWISSLIIYLYQLIIYKVSFSKSDKGLHHLLVGGIFLAFIFVVPIKFISFDQLEVDEFSILPQLKVKRESLKDFHWFIRFLLSFKGLRLTMLHAKLDVSWIFYIEEKKKEEKALIQESNLSDEPIY